MMKPVWWSLSSHHTLLLTRGWGLVIIEFSPHLSPHERVRSGDHWVLATSFSSREGEVWWSLSSRHILFLMREWGLVIIEFLPHPSPHERVRSGDHWVLTTSFSSREGEVWWSLSSHHTLLLMREWGLSMKLVFICTMWNDLCTPYLPLEYSIWSSPPWGYSQENCHWPR